MAPFGDDGVTARPTSIVVYYGKTQVRVARVELACSWSQTRPVNHCRTRGWWEDPELNRDPRIFSPLFYRLNYLPMAGLTGDDPAISCVTGKRPLHLAHSP